MTCEEFLRTSIKGYIDTHPFDRSNMAIDLAPYFPAHYILDRFGGLTEEFIIACAEVVETFYERHQWN